jgi:hypothetical protein
MSDSGMEDLGYEPPDRVRMTRAFWELSQAALDASDWTQNHRMENLQAIMRVERS